MAKFTFDNTEGYDATQLKALNEAFDAAMAEQGSIADDDRHEVEQAVAEQVLRDFDPAGA